MPTGTHSTVGGVAVDELAAGNARLKRFVYPPGWRWSTDMQPVTGTASCRHAHVGFVAQGSLEVVYDDGCATRYDAPTFAVIEPGHDGWVVGDEPAVFVQLDHGPATVDRLGLRGAHAHDTGEQGGD